MRNMAYHNNTNFEIKRLTLGLDTSLLNPDALQFEVVLKYEKSRFKDIHNGLEI
jgi:hypothetical protein